MHWPPLRWTSGGYRTQKSGADVQYHLDSLGKHDQDSNLDLSSKYITKDVPSYYSRYIRIHCQPQTFNLSLVSESYSDIQEGVWLWLLCFQDRKKKSIRVAILREKTELLGELDGE